MSSAVALGLIVFVRPCTPEPANPTIHTTVCEITRHLGDFDGKNVVFHARVESDGIERTVLMDDKAECPRGLIPAAVTGNKKSERAEKAMTKLVYRGHPGTLDKEIEGDFVGLISLEKAEDFGFSPTFPKVGVLRLESIRNLIEKSIVSRP